MKQGIRQVCKHSSSMASARLAAKLTCPVHRMLGIFMDSAQDLITRPEPTDADLQKRFRTTVDHALRNGLTSLHDAGFKPESYAFFER